MTTQPITKPAAGSQAAATVAGQAGPSARDGVLRPAHGLRARFGGIGRRERWGYGVWLFVGLVFGVLESWAGITSPPWSALSDTVGLRRVGDRAGEPGRGEVRRLVERAARDDQERDERRDGQPVSGGTA